MHLILGRNLLPRENLAGMTINGIEADDVLICEFRNGTFDCGSALGTLAEVSGDFRREPGIGGLSHQGQGLTDLLVIDNPQKG